MGSGGQRYEIRSAGCISGPLALSGCWFVWLPGSVVSGAADAIQGLQGQHCVATNVKVGDKVKGPDGSMWTAQKLEGTSARCTNQFMPIRAYLTQDI